MKTSTAAIVQCALVSLAMTERDEKQAKLRALVKELGLDIHSIDRWSSADRVILIVLPLFCLTLYWWLQ